MQARSVPFIRKAIFFFKAHSFTPTRQLTYVSLTKLYHMASKVGWKVFSFWGSKLEMAKRNGLGKRCPGQPNLHAVFTQRNSQVLKYKVSWWWKFHQYSLISKFLSQNHWLKFMAILYKWNKDSVLICSIMFKTIVNISVLLYLGDLSTETSSKVSFGRHQQYVKPCDLVLLDTWTLTVGHWSWNPQSL